MCEHTDGHSYLRARDARLIQTRAEIDRLEHAMEMDASCNVQIVSEKLEVLYSVEEELEQSQTARVAQVLTRMGFSELR